MAASDTTRAFIIVSALLNKNADAPEVDAVSRALRALVRTKPDALVANVSFEFYYDLNMTQDGVRLTYLVEEES